jgi:preprotein translocase subunit SecA
MDFKEEEKPLSGFDTFMNTIIGKAYTLFPHKYFLFKEAVKISKLSLSYELLNEEQFREKIQEMKKTIKLSKGKVKKETLLHAFAIICEASFRSLEIRPYSVQILGALSMYHGFIVQMHTGEGKTITAGLTAVLYAWGGKPCHVVTSNDYLALRDSESLMSFYALCGLSVGFIGAEMETDERREIYQKSIVYATSNEILADFLRDQMHSNTAHNFNTTLLNALKKNYNTNQVLQGLHNIIIDEADSLLADEATTPLIISIPKENKPLTNAIIFMNDISKRLIKEEHYTLNPKYKEVYLTSEGETFIEELIENLTPLWKSKNRREYILKQTLVAKEFYFKGIDYVIVDEKLVIVDEKTGRLVPNRSWGNGLHQAVEAKENIDLSPPTQTHIKMSFQRFFRLYKNISGMSGTLQKLNSELWYIYKLPTMKIPKRIQNNYKILKEKIVSTKAEKWSIIVENIKEIHHHQQPILVGTRTIEESEYLSKALNEIGISHQILNALYHEEEAQIIEKAGGLSMVTIATNMAGRGTDIKVDKEAIKRGGLYVITTERHSSERVDMQLFGRTARQGQAGMVQRVVSLEDELFVNKSFPWIRKIFQSKINSSLWQYFIILFYKKIQKRSDKEASKKRRQILVNDFSTKQMLSFSEK